MDKTTIGISALITLGIVIASIVGPSYFDEPKYFCEARPEIGVVSCDSFSKYVSENGKCIREDNTNLICREGWALVTDDRQPPEEIEEPEPTPQPTPTPSPSGTKYRCDQTKCVIIE